MTAEAGFPIGRPAVSRPPGWTRVPPLLRAFLRYVVRARDPGLLPVMWLQREVEGEIEAIVDGLFGEVEDALAAAVGRDEVDLVPGAEGVRFDYDTRLLLPAMLTLGRVHVLADDLPLARRVRDVDGDLVERGRATTREIVRALLDGDMRDAINDDEFGDFETTVRPRSVAAEIAQSTLQAGVEAWFDADDTPPAVREHYERAVAFSEAHQDRDRDFRDLLAAFLTARGSDRERLADRIRDRYRNAEPGAEAEGYGAGDLPYFATQFARVGVIYDAMLAMYEADLGVDLGDGYGRALVLMVIAAQVGLDDTDDYPEDRQTQLTPVTAELNLAGPEAGLESLSGIVRDYLDRARAASGDHLTGMAIEFIRQEAADRLDRLGRTVAPEPESVPP